MIKLSFKVCREINHAAKAIQVYEVVHTGPTTRSGVLHEGFFNLASASTAERLVRAATRSAVDKETMRNCTSTYPGATIPLRID
jgi:hypothetical protein